MFQAYLDKRNTVLKTAWEELKILQKTDTCREATLPDNKQFCQNFCRQLVNMTKLKNTFTRQS